MSGVDVPGYTLLCARRASDPRTRSIKSDRPVLGESEFRTFYEDTARPLFAYLVRVIRDRALAEDLLQESYCRLLAAAEIPRDAVHRRRYLFRIATNLMRDRWRRGSTDTADAASHSLAEVAAVGADQDLAIEVHRAMEQLKARERQLLWLAYVEGSNHREIAHCTGLKEGSIRLLLFRARRKLAGLLGVDPHPKAKAVK